MSRDVVVSLYDVKSEAYEGLYFFVSSGVARRYFEHFKDQIPFYGDKVAYIVASFDSNRGMIHPLDPCDFIPLFGEEENE